MTDTILYAEEKEKDNARALARSFVTEDVRSRAYVNVLGAELCLKFLKQNNISDEKTYNMHDIRKLLSLFDIADVMLSNIHIDVRVVYSEDEIFIPKSHFDYKITPDIYLVLKISKDYSKAELLGFFEPKLLNKKNTNGEYYFMEKEKLSSPSDLKSFIETFNGNTNVEYDENDVEKAQFLILSMSDDNIAEKDKKKLLNFLKTSAEIRDKFIEFENFEILAAQASGIVEAEDVDMSEEVSDDIEELVPDITENIEQSNIEDIFETGDTSDEKSSIEELAEGAAILGAGIAGSAVASAALSGISEGENLIDNAADIVSDVFDIAENISDEGINNSSMSETDEVILEESAGILDNSDIEGNLEEFFDAGSSDDNEVKEFGIEDMFAYSDSDDEDVSDDIIFENNDDEYEMEDTPTSSRGPAIGIPAISPTASTPISEATELISMESIKMGDIPPLDIPKNVEEIMETMEVSEYQNFGDNDSSQEISNEISEADIVSSNDNIKDSIEEVSDVRSNEVSDVKSAETAPMKKVESDAYVQEMPDEIRDLSEIKTDDLNSDNFVQEMPDEIQDLSEIKLDDLNSNNFVQEMPDEIQDLSEIKLEDLNSDNFVQEMPDEIQDLSEIKLEDLNSDNFVQEMPNEIQDLSEIKLDNLNSDNFVQEMPDEIQNVSVQNDAGDFNSVKNINKEPIEEPVANEELALPDGVDLDSGLTIGEIEDQIPDISSEELSVQEEVKESEFSDSLPDDGQSVLSRPEIVDYSVDAFSDETDLSILDELSELEIGGEEPYSAQISEEGSGSSDVVEQSEMGINIHDSVPDIQEEVLTDDNFITEEPITSEGILSSISNIDDISDYDESGNGSEISETDNPELGVLYRDDSESGFDGEQLPQEDEEYYDYRPQRKNIAVMPVLTILTAVVIAGSVVGFIMKNKSDIDSDTLIQASPESTTLAGPETDNTGILANNGIEPAIPTKNDNGNIVADSAKMNDDIKKELVKDTKESVKTGLSKKPLNANKTITLKRLSWEVPDYLSYSDNMKRYLQSAGKSIKLTLTSDLLLTNEYIYSNKVKVNLQLSKDGTVQKAQIGSSSGSNQIDKIVLQTVKDTLNVVKPVAGEVPTPTYNLGLIIYL